MSSTASPSAPVLGSIVAGRYEVRDELGEGAQGRVLEALDRKLGRLVALKILPVAGHEDAEALQRFHAEARAAARLRHPAIVTVYDTGEGDGFAWMAMELVIGQTLRDALRAAGTPPLPEALRIIRELLDALDAAHARGVVHRDVKPSNILLAVDAEDGLGAVRLADFGIASMAGIGVGRAGDIVGTPAVMAPEQIRGEALDHRVDLWSAGIVFYELVTGSMPFVGGLPKIYDTILHREPLAPSLLKWELPPAFDAIIRRALEKDPERRFQSAREMQAAIAALPCGIGDAPEVAPPPKGSMAPPGAARPGYRLGLALAFLAGVATGAGGLLAVVPGRVVLPPPSAAAATGPAEARHEPGSDPTGGASPAMPAPAAAAADPGPAMPEPETDRTGAATPAAHALADAATSPAEAPREAEADRSAAALPAAAAPGPAAAPREPALASPGVPPSATLAATVEAASPAAAPPEPEAERTEAAPPAAARPDATMQQPVAPAAEATALAGMPAEDGATDARPPAPATLLSVDPAPATGQAAHPGGDAARNPSQPSAEVPPAIAAAPACEGEGPQIATGNHPRFGRFVLRWSQPTAYRALPGSGGLRLEFDAQPCISLPDRIAMPRNIRAVRAGPSFVEIDPMPGREVRHFTLDRRTVVDVYD